ncbi:hypothetical protein BN1110_05682 [bacterium YEK0313]|nr:hypothetical protein BN1110_05682 [bacterium YEK0313]
MAAPVPCRKPVAEPRRIVTEADIDAVLDAHAGDSRAAVRAVLEDLAMIAERYSQRVSHGYERGFLAAERRP